MIFNPLASYFNYYVRISDHKLASLSVGSYI